MRARARMHAYARACKALSAQTLAHGRGEWLMHADVRTNSLQTSTHARTHANELTHTPADKYKRTRHPLKIGRRTRKHNGVSPAAPASPPRRVSAAALRAQNGVHSTDVAAPSSLLGAAAWPQPAGLLSRAGGHALQPA
eukprot:5746557-Pleurochrysis_carterae.AAC.1